MAPVPAVRRGAARALPWLFLTYLLAGLLHFAHNAEYLPDYPNLPAWLTRAQVYGSFAALTALGLAGLALWRYAPVPGLVLLAAYAFLGFDGLLHYRRAPFAAHSAVMNFTILTEVAAAAVLLACVLRLLAAPARAARA
ncbi:MAG TPA: hypothetical protein VL994_06850 [Steroidobacteraceae bacterium]|nr:hypothetical protein [Steroidobacteraceae bacterium]